MNPRIPCLSCGRLASRKYRPRCRACGAAFVRDLSGHITIGKHLGLKNDVLTNLGFDEVCHEPIVLRIALPSASADAKNRMEAEAKALSLVSHCNAYPQFINANSVPETGGVYTAQTHIDGIPIKKAMKRKKVAYIVERFKTILKALEVLHRSGHVHCGISDHKILLQPDEEVCIINLLNVRPTGSPSHGRGSRGFKAPEQLDGASTVSPQTDCFAVGVCLYRALCRRWPYSPWRVKQLSSPGYTPRPPSRFNKRVSPELDAVILKALSREPVDRFASAGEFLIALSSVFGSKTVVDIEKKKRLWFSFPFYLLLVEPLLTIGSRLWRASLRWTRFTGRIAREGKTRFMELPRNMRIGLTAATLAAAIVLPGCFLVDWVAPQTMAPTPVVQVAVCPVRFHTFPAARVYHEEQFLGEAPGPADYVVSSGNARFKFVSKSGELIMPVNVNLRAGTHYLIKVNLERKHYEIQTLRR